MRIHLKPGRGFLTVALSGPFNLYLANELTPRILDACARHNASKLLVDARGVSGILTLAERFLYSENLARNYKGRRVVGTIKHIQFAYVADPPILDPQRFGERVATSRGLHLKAVPTMEDAYEWLGVKEPDAE